MGEIVCLVVDSVYENDIVLVLLGKIGMDIEGGFRCWSRRE